MTANYDRAQIVRDARQIHRTWFRLRAAASGGAVLQVHGVPLTCEWGPLRAATIAFPRLTGPEVGAALDDILAWCRTRGPLHVGHDLAQIAFVEAIGTGNVTALEEMRSSLKQRQLDAQLPCGLRPVQVAALLRQPQVVCWLAAKGATIDVITACELGQRKRVPEMLRKRPEIADMRLGPEGATALHRAAAAGDQELVSWLLHAGADRTLTDHAFRSTPAGWARHFGHVKLAAYIESFTM